MNRRFAPFIATVALCFIALYSITTGSAFADAPQNRAEELALIGEKTGTVASDSSTSDACQFDEGYGAFLCPEASPAQLPQRDPAAQARLRAHVAGGNSVLLIPDSTADRVMAFDPETGDVLDLNFIPADKANLSTPINAILSPSGDSILLSDQLEDNIYEYGLDGAFIGLFAGENTALLDNILGIALRPNGNLLVSVTAGANADSIAQFDTSGTYLNNFIGSGSGGLDGPFDVYARPVISDWLVASIDGAEALIRYNYNTGALIGTLNSVTNFPEQVTTAANGDVLVANFGGSQEGIVRFSSTGTLIGVIDPTTEGGYRGVYELGNGNLLITTGVGVYEVTPTGTIVEPKITGVSARFIEEVQLPASGTAISLDTTVGTNSSICADTDELLIGAPTTVYYCYTVTNTGSVTLTRHDLVDSELGPILTNFPFTLVPGASAFITQSNSITSTTVSSATWTSREAAAPLGGEVSASDNVTVTLGTPSINLNKTVGTDSSICATTDSITITDTTTVYYCYTVANTGDLTVTRHDLSDSELGVILDDFPFTLVPNSTAFITQSALITTTTVNTAVWTAFNVGGNPASATDVATVTLPGPTAVSLAMLNSTAATLPITTFALGGLLLLAVAGWLITRKR